MDVAHCCISADCKEDGPPAAARAQKVELKQNVQVQLCLKSWRALKPVPSVPVTAESQLVSLPHIQQPIRKRVTHKPFSMLRCHHKACSRRTARQQASWQQNTAMLSLDVTHSLCGLSPVLNMMRSADNLAPFASSTVQLLLLLLLEPPAS
jgi:hypothetical protein